MLSASGGVSVPSHPYMTPPIMTRRTLCPYGTGRGFGFFLATRLNVSLT